MSSSLAEAVESFVLLFFPSTRKVFIYQRTCHLLPETWQVRKIRLVFLRAKTLRAFLAPSSPTYPRRTTPTGSLSLPLRVPLSTPVSADLAPMRAFPVSPLRSDHRRCASPSPPPASPLPVARVRGRDRCKRKPESLQLVFRARGAALRRIRS